MRNNCVSRVTVLFQFCHQWNRVSIWKKKKKKKTYSTGYCRILYRHLFIWYLLKFMHCWQIQTNSMSTYPLVDGLTLSILYTQTFLMYCDFFCTIVKIFHKEISAICKCYFVAVQDKCLVRKLRINIIDRTLVICVHRIVIKHMWKYHFWKQEKSCLPDNVLYDLSSNKHAKPLFCPKKWPHFFLFIPISCILT